MLWGGFRTKVANIRRRQIYRRCLAAPTKAIVLRYHSVGDPKRVTPYVDPGLSLSPARFREHLRLLKRRFRVVSLDAVLERLASGQGGEPIAAVTFDDGYRDNHDVALPILMEEGCTATFFVTSRPLEPGRWFWISELRGIVPRLPAGPMKLAADSIIEVPVAGTERSPLRRELTQILSAMSEADREAAMNRLVTLAEVPRGAGLEATFLTAALLRRLVENGMSVGGHTRSHPHLDRLDRSGLEEEIAGGKADLEAALGTAIRHFAYPNPGGGQKNEAAVREVLRASGYASAVTSQPDPLAPGTDALALPRLGVYADIQERVLFEVLEGA